MQVHTFIHDTVRPILVSVGLDMDSRILTFTFSKPVSVSSIKLDQLTLQSDETTQIRTEFVQFSPLLATVLTQHDSNIIQIFIEQSAFFTIKHSPNLGKSVDTTYIAISNKFVTDTVLPQPNLVFEITNAAALKVCVG
jgi:hypothetical protein